MSAERTVNSSLTPQSRASFTCSGTADIASLLSSTRTLRSAVGWTWQARRICRGALIAPARALLDSGRRGERLLTLEDQHPAAGAAAPAAAGRRMGMFPLRLISSSEAPTTVCTWPLPK